MPPLPESPRWRRTASFATVVIVVATLYLAQDLLLPFAVAALLTFLLAPVVSLLQRLRLPRIVAVVVAVFVAIGGVGALGAMLVVQLDDLAESLPQYRDTIRAKLASLGGVVAVELVLPGAVDLGLHLGVGFAEELGEEVALGGGGDAASGPARADEDRGGGEQESAGGGEEAEDRHGVD